MIVWGVHVGRLSVGRTLLSVAFDFVFPEVEQDIQRPITGIM